MNLKHLIAVALLSTLMFGCGGGSDSGGDSKGGIELGGGDNGNDNNNGGNAHQKLSGDWLSQCFPLTDNGNGVRGFTATIGFFTDDDDGEEGYGEAYRYYDTRTCDAGLLLRIGLAGPITYQGQLSTSVCVAEKYQAPFLGASITNSNGKKTLVGSELDEFLKSAKIDKTRIDRACIYNNQLLIGKGSNEMALSTPFTRKNQKLLIDTLELNTSLQIDSNLVELLQRSQKAMHTH